MAFSSTPTACDWKALRKSLQNFCLHSLKKVVTNNRSGNDDCALLVTKNGKVFSTGKSSDGCLGLEGVTETAEPVELKELSGVAGVCVCGYYGDALAYTREGKVYVWGKNAKPIPCNTPQLVPELTDIVDARCNGGHYLALTKSGKVYEWRGVNNTGSLLNGLSTTPKVVELNDVIMSIACGPAHSLALTEDGQVYSWGKKYINNEFVDQPMTKIPLPGETVAKVACGCTHSLVLTHSGKVYTWGHNDCGLGDPSDSTQLATPVEVGQNIGRFVDIAINGHRTNAAVSNTGAIYAWGEGELAFGWSNQAVLLLLEEYRSKKMQFRDPKIKKSQLWKEIGDLFLKKGYSVNADLLSTKFRNLKKTYTSIVDNNSKSKTGRGRVMWEYYDLFQEIFREDRTLNILPNTIMSSCIVVEEEPSTSHGEIQPQTSVATPEETFSKSPFVGKKKSKSFRWRQIEEQRKNFIKLEQDRITQLQKLTEAVETNNKIQTERNNMFKEYLEHLKTKKQ